MNKIKFGILSGLMTSVLVVVPSFAADLTALQGSTLDLSGTTSSDTLVTFVNKGVDFSQSGSSFYINTDGNLKLQAAKGKNVVVDHNNLAFSGNDTYVSKYGDPKIDFNRGGSLITAEGDSLNVESDGTVKLIGDAVRVDHNYLKFVNDTRYPIPTIDFVKEGAKITAEDGVKIEGDKGLEIAGPLKVTGAQTLTGNQTITGNQHVTGTLIVDGVATLASGIVLQNGETIENTTNGTVDVLGKAIITGTRMSNAPTVAGDVPENFLEVTGDITGVGALGLGSANTRLAYLGGTRAVGNNTVYADTQDNGLKISITNRSTANATGYTVRGMDVLARSRSSGNTTSLSGAYISGTNDSSPGAAGDVYGVQANVKNDGVASGTVAALYAQNQSASATGTNYGVFVDSTGDGGTAKNASIVVKSTNGSWNYGLDMNGTTVNTADIRLKNAETISNSPDGTVAISGTVSATGGLIIPNGADPGATCTVGQIYLDTDQTVDTTCTTTADNSLCVCTATNTWTAFENN